MLRIGRIGGHFEGLGLRRVLRWPLRIGVCLVGVAAVALWWFLNYAALPLALREQPPLTGIYLDTKGRLIAELATPEARSHRPISLQEMGPWIPRITVALEDQRFHQHHGVDFRAVVRALVHQNGGGSTITQQFVKVATRRQGRSVIAKANEALMALQLERRWTKQQILEAYLNRISYGNQLIGVEAAAHAYFDKPASALSRDEAIYLAGLPQRPSQLNPWTHPEAAGRQFVRCTRSVAGRDESLAAGISEEDLPSVLRKLPKNQAPHFVQSASHGRLCGTMRCTLDLDLQQHAEQLVREHLATLRRPDVTEAALVILENQTGAVRAFVGSRSFEASQINGALTFRNSGSTLKPFLYLTGIDQRVFTAATLLPDTADAVRDVYSDYDPHNFVLAHLGPVRVREALGNSLNVPAVVAVNRIGARKAYNAIEDWGISFDRPLEKAGAGFILGNVGVRLLDLTSAFAALARGGLVTVPRFRVDDSVPLRRVASAEAVQIVTDILCDNSARFLSFGRHSVLAFPKRVAVKTGTSAGFRDTWTVGFTNEHTVGVWVGNFDGSPMGHVASTAAAAPLWRRMINDLLVEDHPVRDATFPRVEICSLTGLLPVPASPSTFHELFLPGTEPQTNASEWFSEDGQVRLPVEYAGWCASRYNRLGATLQERPGTLQILTPRDRAIFLVDASLPTAQQQLELRSSASTGVEWRINGERVPSLADGSAMWPLRAGEWTLEAATSAAHHSIRFTVTQEQARTAFQFSE